MLSIGGLFPIAITPAESAIMPPWQALRNRTSEPSDRAVHSARLGNRCNRAADGLRRYKYAAHMLFSSLYLLSTRYRACASSSGSMNYLPSISHACRTWRPCGPEEWSIVRSTRVYAVISSSRPDRSAHRDQVTPHFLVGSFVCALPLCPDPSIGRGGSYHCFRWSRRTFLRLRSTSSRSSDRLMRHRANPLAGSESFRGRSVRFRLLERLLAQNSIIRTPRFLCNRNAYTDLMTSKRGSNCAAGDVSTEPSSPSTQSRQTSVSAAETTWSRELINSAADTQSSRTGNSTTMLTRGQVICADQPTV